MSTYRPHAEQPHHPFLGIFQGATTDTGKRSLHWLGVDLAFFAAMPIGLNLDQAPVFAIGLLGAGPCFLVGVGLAWNAILENGERAPSVVMVAVIPPALIFTAVVMAGVAGLTLAATKVALTVVVAAVINEFLAGLRE